MVAIEDTLNERILSQIIDGELSLNWELVDDEGHSIYKRDSLAKYSKDGKILKILPQGTNPNDTGPQFTNIREIWIDAPLSPHEPEEIAGPDEFDGRIELFGLPGGFGAKFFYGLSIRTGYRKIFSEIDQVTQCRIVNMTSAATDPGVQGNQFILSIEKFEEFVRKIKQTKQRADSARYVINSLYASNLVAEITGDPKKKLLPGRLQETQQLRSAISDEAPWTISQLSELAVTFSSHAKDFAEKDPLKLKSVLEDLELVSIETLIHRFENNLRSGKSFSEYQWQKFFEQNDFILKQIFAMPAIYYDREVSVRFADAKNGGQRKADFILYNALSRSMLVLELKTPKAKLSSSKIYRGAEEHGSDVYAPHEDLSGAVAQLLSQLASSREDFRLILQRTRAAEMIEPSTVIGALIIGTLTELSAEQKVSFELYRQSLHGFQILTYDELLERLKMLVVMLRADEGERDS
ncbi:Shedu anti-phage system protein SduA domain-containing protein [Glutamicibacter ardleyensis]|uniref:Shedu anti-phage system protein SduA domain-containing protein n=1 Tax=Glutamicibacter ardleyensis TaxID=225894 RepID=UPI003FD3D5B6